jgi:hypothetical protein
MAWDCYLWMSGQKRPPADKTFPLDNMALRRCFVFFLSLYIDLQNGRHMGTTCGVTQATYIRAYAKTII